MTARPPAGAVVDERFDAGRLHLLREAVLANAAAAGLSESRATDVMITVHELAANVIRHGAGTGRLRMELAGGVLRCTVEDGRVPGLDGPAGVAQPDEQAGADGAAGWRSGRGHGLWLARQMADQVIVASWPDGSRVTVVFEPAAAQG